MDSAILSPLSCVDDVVPHTVREFGLEARKPDKAWVTAFNGPIQVWHKSTDDQPQYLVTARIARLKDTVTRELFSTNLLFYLRPDQMRGVHNIYDLAVTNPFCRLRGPRTVVPCCPPRPDALWYDAN